MYLDDLLIYSSTFTEHIHHTDLFLDKFTSAGYTVNPNKCQFGKPEIKFLVLVTSDEGVKVD
jgi:Reverse transcriptase (RNA-dependent DNA polymerase).